MCIVSYLPPGIPVDTDGFLNGALTNRDGHGWAIADPALDFIVMGRSLNPVEAIDDFVKAREKHPNGAALFHSRISTHGRSTLANCHPFMVDGSHKTVLAHNGILPHDAWPDLNDPEDRSDSRFFADEMLMQKYPELDKFSVKRRLERWAGSFNKIVILTVDRRFACNAYLINEWHGQWDRETGIWHSNPSYKSLPKWKPTKTTYGYSNYGGTNNGVGTIATSRPGRGRKSSKKARANIIKSASDSAAVFLSQIDDECSMCGMGSMEYGYCQYCDSCETCGDIYDNCVCWKAAIDSYDETYRRTSRNPVRYTSQTEASVASVCSASVKEIVAATAGKVAEPSGEAAKIAADIIARNEQQKRFDYAIKNSQAAREQREYRGGTIS